MTYYHNNLFGNVVAASDENGQLLWRKAYQPFGQLIEDGSTKTTDAQGYSGKRYDKETGLLDFGARVYSPLLGRFLSIDPAEVQGDNPFSFNRYIYANDNPYKYKDPDGRTAVEFFNDLGNGIDNGSRIGIGGRGSYNYGSAFWVGTAIGEASWFLPGAQERNGAKIAGKLAANNIANAGRLAEQLTFQEASSIFTKSGQLKSEVIKSSSRIIPGSELGNPALTKKLEGMGGSINDWAKYETQSFKSPSGPFKAHFYRNESLNKNYFGMDYKSIFNHQSKWK